MLLLSDTHFMTFIWLLDFKQVVIPTNETSADYESAMQMKVMIFTSLFYSRL